MHAINRTWQFLVVVGLIFLSIALFSIYKASAQDIPAVATCPGVAGITHPSNNEQVDGLLEILVSDTGIGTQEPSKVELFVNSNFIGQAFNLGSVWEKQWPSSSVGNGQKELKAVFYEENGQVETPVCVTQPVNINIVNDSGSVGGPSQLDIKIFQEGTPILGWEGPTYSNPSFEAEAYLIDSNGDEQNVTDQTDFDWSVAGTGSITFENHANAQYSSGPRAGTGTIKVQAVFNGKMGYDEVPTKVNDSTTASRFPSTDELSDDSVNKIINKEQQVKNDGTKQAQQLGDPKMENCLAKAMGAESYKNMVNNHSRLTFDEMEKSQSCFAKNRFVIPSTIAPIDPAQIEGLAQDRDVFINKIRQAWKNDVANGFTLSGIANPDEIIMIYVFSEPLVLTTSTDSNGNFSYTIEDPMEPGEHTAYVAVQNDEGEFVRSNSFIFSVAQAASTEDNPNGLSLQLNESGGESYARYILIVSVIVFVAIVSFMLIIRHRIRKKQLQKELEHHGLSGSSQSFTPEA